MAETANTHASTEAHGSEAHAKPKALGMDATMWVALAMLLVIALFIWKKVPSMIGAALDKQIAGIRDQLDQATNLRKEAEAVKANADEEAKQIVAKAKEDATALIARRAQSAEEKIAAAERAAVADVRAKAASAAAAAAAMLIAQHHDAEADAGLVDETIAKLN
jgi:F-type H+-transporting ATPase subunit b